MVDLRIRKLIVACRWKSGPGSCQEPGSRLAARADKRVTAAAVNVDLVFASFRGSRNWHPSGRRVDRQRVILTSQGGQCGCYLGQACADVGCHGLSSAAVIFVSGVGLGCREAEVALTGTERFTNHAEWVSVMTGR
jgi:hypothetical protein